MRNRNSQSSTFYLDEPKLDYSGYLERADRVFNHFLNLREKNSPVNSIKYFRWLFIEGAKYPDPSILNAVYEIATSEWAEKEFPNLLNRCSYILLNYWLTTPNSNYDWATIELIKSFDILPKVSVGSKEAKRLRELVRKFRGTQQYKTLQSRAQVAANTSYRSSATENEYSSQSEACSKRAKRKQIRDLIHRYPCLYPNYLLSYDDDSLGRRGIKKLRIQQERKFEEDLWHYAYQLTKSTNQLSSKLNNPTLMSAQELNKTVRHFVSRVEGTHTYSSSAQQFLEVAISTTTYTALKQQIHGYLTDFLQYSPYSSYSKQRFQDWLSDQFKNMLSDSDHSKPTGILLVHTCDQLLEAFIADPKICPERHYRFIDLHANLGATWLIGLILKLVLLCRYNSRNLEIVNSRVSNRFALVFKHYERSDQREVEWLTECLDNLMISNAIHFGNRSSSQWLNLLDTHID